MTSRNLWKLLSLLLVLALAGCGGVEADVPLDDPPVPVAAAEPDAPEPLADRAGGDVLRTGPFERSIGGVSFSVPDGWQETPLASGQFGFVDARFVIPAGDDEVELTFTSVGGGIQANLERWIGQFQRPPGEPRPQIERLRLNEVEASWIDLRGTYTGGASGRPGPHPAWRMLGVGIPRGDRDLYLKLNGPAETVAQIYDDFRQFVRTARP